VGCHLKKNFKNGAGKRPDRGASGDFQKERYVEAGYVHRRSPFAKRKMTSLIIKALIIKKKKKVVCSLGNAATLGRGGPRGNNKESN